MEFRLQHVNELLQAQKLSDDLKGSFKEIEDSLKHSFLQIGGGAADSPLKQFKKDLTDILVNQGRPAALEAVGDEIVRVKKEIEDLKNTPGAGAYVHNEIVAYQKLATGLLGIQAKIDSGLSISATQHRNDEAAVSKERVKEETDANAKILEARKALNSLLNETARVLGKDTFPADRERLVVVAVVVFVETAQRRIVVQYPKRQVGNKMYGGEASHLPLKINTSGVIPPIFASSLLLFPATIASFQGAAGEPGWVQWIATYLGHGQPLYLLAYIGLIVFFCFFYTTVVFNPTDTADNLKKNGGFVPGIRPGKNTADYLEYILNRLTVIGALYLSAVCILPELLIARGGVPFYFGGTSLLIVVSVTLDTVTQIQAHLLAHQYEGLIKKARLRGRGR